MYKYVAQISQIGCMCSEFECYHTPTILLQVCKLRQDHHILCNLYSRFYSGT